MGPREALRYVANRYGRLICALVFQRLATCSTAIKQIDASERGSKNEPLLSINTLHSLKSIRAKHIVRIWQDGRQTLGQMPSFESIWRNTWRRRHCLKTIVRYAESVSISQQCMSAALAIDYRILPWSKKATLSDIQKCMNDAMGDLIAGLEPGMAAGGQKDLDLTAFSDLVDRANFVSLNSADRKTKSFIRRLRRADGFTKCDKIGVSHAFLFAKTFKHWYPNGTDRKRLTKLLRSRRMFRSGRRRDTCTREIFIAELGGKVSCYSLALKR